MLPCWRHKRETEREEQPRKLVWDGAFSSRAFYLGLSDPQQHTHIRRLLPYGDTPDVRFFFSDVRLELPTWEQIKLSSVVVLLYIGCLDPACPPRWLFLLRAKLPLPVTGFARMKTI